MTIGTFKSTKLNKTLVAIFLISLNIVAAYFASTYIIVLAQLSVNTAAMVSFMYGLGALVLGLVALITYASLLAMFYIIGIQIFRDNILEIENN